jgi:hypothetical protein
MNTLYHRSPKDMKDETLQSKAHCNAESFVKKKAFLQNCKYPY